MRTTGPVADSFLARLDAEEASRLSPLAVRSSQTRGRLRRRGALRSAQPVPARPRSHRPLQGVPAAEAQDAGLRRARGRPLPHAPHAHARGGRHLAHGRPRAAPQRGSHRGHRARPRSRPPAVRARRRGGARRRAARALRRRLPPQRAFAARRRRARARRPWPQPHARGARRHPQPHRARHAASRSRAASSSSSTASRTSTTTSTTRCAPACSTPASCRDGPVALLGATGSARIDAIVHDLVETSEVAGDIRQSEPVAEAMLALRAFLFERVYGRGPAARGGRSRRLRRAQPVRATSATTRTTWTTAIRRSTWPRA